MGHTQHCCTVLQIAETICYAYNKYGIILFHSDENIYDEESLKWMTREGFNAFLSDGVSYIFFDNLEEVDDCLHSVNAKIKHQVLNRLGELVS